MSIRYQKSEELLKRALKVIPNGTCTFSKSRSTYPFGISPFYASKGLGSCLWDEDGNEYIDFIMGLCPNVLGYGDPDIMAAVLPFISNPALSLPHKIEIEVAEKICEMVPCAEMVRFAKNGSNATTGAVRVAREFTQRPFVVKCHGHYHGGDAWTIMSSNDSGLTYYEQKDTLLMDYNDIDSLKHSFICHPGLIACVIMEPMNTVWPKPGFLEAVKELCHQNGALFILDEVITGFRFANGGAQEYFNVTPDLCCLGKAMGNGFPISAVAGRADIMKLFEKVHFSFTFASDNISLAAANAVLDKLKREPVCKRIHQIGSEILAETALLLELENVSHFLDINGHPSWTHLKFHDCNGYEAHEIKTLWQQEIYKRGILCIGYHAVSYAHTMADVKQLLGVYSEVFPILKDAVENRKLHEYLECEPCRPLFKIR